MIVDQFSTEIRDGSRCIRARVRWECVERPDVSLFFEANDSLLSHLQLDPNAFLLAVVLPAWKFCEKRVLIDEQLCPVLLRNLTAVFQLISTWCDWLGVPPTIEATQGMQLRNPSPGSSLTLMSCGIDSLATLRWNQLHIPTSHPLSIRGAVSVCHHSEMSASVAEFEKRVAVRGTSAIPVAKDVAIEWTSISTNCWWLVNDGYFFDEVWHAAMLSAAAALLGYQYNRLYIPASNPLHLLSPWGSHPLLDPFYSSAHMQIEHSGIEMSRLEKTKLIAKWPMGLQNIRVCQNNLAGDKNCGTCEKCIQTMLALMTVGALENCAAFPVTEVTPELINTLTEYKMIRDDYTFHNYRELVPVLETYGRDDLAKALRLALREVGNLPQKR